MTKIEITVQQLELTPHSMPFSGLANELLLDIFRACTSVADVFNLSLTCRRLYTLLRASRRISILFSAAEAEFGPVKDIIQLVTLNSNQGTTSSRNPPTSIPLLRLVVSVGRVAKRWETIYPIRKWRGDCAVDRRSLSTVERYCLRRALYRYWLYSDAFHNACYPRTVRMNYHAIIERTDLLRQWTTDELLEIEDMCHIIRTVLHTQICPSDGTVQRRLQRYYPGQARPSLASTEPQRRRQCTVLASHVFHGAHHFSEAHDAVTSPLDMTGRDSHTEGWGDEIAQYYIVEDMMKLDPRQILVLLDQPLCKRQVEEYIDAQGSYFVNNGQTLAQTLAWVMQARGQELEELREHITDGTMGIAKI